VLIKGSRSAGLEAVTESLVDLAGGPVTGDEGTGKDTVA